MDRRGERLSLLDVIRDWVEQHAWSGDTNEERVVNADDLIRYLDILAAQRKDD